MQNEQPPIPLALFRKMATSLTAKELSRIPPEKLPDAIPLDLLESLDAANAAKVDELILDRQALILRRSKALSRSLGTEGAAACHLAERGKTDAPAHELEVLLTKLQPKRKVIAQNGNVSQAIRLLDELNDAAPLIKRVRSDQNRILHYRKILRPKLFHPCEFESTARRADKLLGEFNETNSRMMGRYYAERCAICLLVMRSYTSMRRQHSKIRGELAQHLTVLKGRMHSVATQSSMLKNANTKTPYVTKLSKEIKSLFSKLRLHDITLSESDLKLWLDIVLDMSLYRRTDPVYESLTSRAEETLSELIRAYFDGILLDKTEQASQFDAESAIDNPAESQQEAKLFLQRFLQTKQQDMATHQCISAADRLYAFKRVERKLMSVIH